jgi:tRNA(Ile)-lysidine synthase
LTDKVAQALQAGAAFVVWADGVPRPGAIAVALSGGRDSVALLHATRAAVAASALPVPVVALHVHHGLHAEADAWDAFCAGLCQEWGVSYHSTRATVSPRPGEGIEAAARRARYAALTSLCGDAAAELLLFAHHLDDQVETVLLRLFRGSGVHGLAGMPPMRRLAPDDPTLLLRPWLDIGRAEIDAYCRANGLRWIEDPSNDDTRYARNALRQQLPALVEAFPALRANVAQAAGHLSEAARLLDAQAGRLLATLLRAGRDADTHAELDVAGLRALSPPEADAALRLWLRDLGAQPPSTARLAAMRAQLIETDGGEPAIRHGELVLRRFRGRILACRPPPVTEPVAVALAWAGEGRIAVPAWHGELRFFRDDASGVPESVLRQPLELAPRRGGERIVLRPGGPARPLKQAYQEAGVPAWRRTALPLLWARGQLVMAAGLGMHRRWPEAADEPHWRVEWCQTRRYGAPTQEADEGR